MECPHCCGHARGRKIFIGEKIHGKVPARLCKKRVQFSPRSSFIHVCKGKETGEERENGAKKVIFQLLAFAIPAHALMRAIQVSAHFPHPRLFIHSGRRRSLVDVTAQSHATAFIKTSGHRLGDFLVRPSVRRAPPGSLMGERRKAPGGKREEKGKRGRGGGGAAGANSICQEKVFLFLPPHFLFRPVCLLHTELGVAFIKRFVLATFHKIYLGSSLTNGGGGDGIRLLQAEGGGREGGRIEASAHRGRRQRNASPAAAAAAAAARKTGGGGGKRGRQQGTSLSGVRDSGERTIERRISPHF